MEHESTERVGQESVARLSIRSDNRFQKVKDFGASVCWWPNNGRYGDERNASRYLDLLYSKEGLDFNVIRLNVGGCVKEDMSDSFVCSYAMPHMTPLSPLKEDGDYNITRNKGYWTVTELANNLPLITDFTVFMNTPPSVLTKNGRTAALYGECVSNLREDCYEDYAKYVVEVVERYILAGIPVKYVSPINEPKDYWNEERQEGCHFEPEECIRLWRLVIKELQKRAQRNPAIKSIRISVPEAASWAEEKYVEELYSFIHNDAELREHVDHFAVHSYFANADQKKRFRMLVDSLGEPFIPLHQTEYAPLPRKIKDGMDYALEVARVMTEDLSILHTDHWTWWVMVNDDSWPSGLIAAKNDGSGLRLTKRYFAVKHFSRFIRNKTNVQIDASGLPEKVCASAYVSEDGRTTVLILVNREFESACIRISGAPDNVRPKVYETSETRDCQYLGRILFEGFITLPPRAITSLIFEEN